jgi:hypothetical protein
VRRTEILKAGRQRETKETWDKYRGKKRRREMDGFEREKDLSLSFTVSYSFSRLFFLSLFLSLSYSFSLFFFLSLFLSLSYSFSLLFFLSLLLSLFSFSLFFFLFPLILSLFSSFSLVLFFTLFKQKIYLPVHFLNCTISLLKWAYSKFWA